MATPTDILKQFVKGINTQNTDTMSLCLANEHVYTNSANITFKGKMAALEAWKALFAQLPDYQINFTEIHESGVTVMAFGTAMASAGNKTIDNSFSIPMAIKCTLENEQIVLCQIFADTLKPSQVLDRTAPIDQADKLKVAGFGGVFFKTKDTKATAAWYDKHLGTRFGANSWSTFKWRERQKPGVIGRTEFSLFAEKTDYFDPSPNPFMFNFRVVDLDALIAQLKADGVVIIGDTQLFEYGKFAWVLDLDGNKIELWQPVDDVLEAYDAQ
jgi:predicted enzyme related to lactoylglutathione lyase